MADQTFPATDPHLINSWRLVRFGSCAFHDHADPLYRVEAISLRSRRAKIVSTRGRAIMIAPASSARPRTVVIEASRCWDQVHWSSTSAPLGSPMNGATTTQPTKSHPKARYQVGRLRGLTGRRSRRLIASGTTHTKWCSQDTGEASSPATPHRLTASRTSPSRCHSAAAQTPATATAQDKTSPMIAGSGPSPKIRTMSAITDWFV